METESRSQPAIRAACAVATDLGLSFERAIVLQHRSNAIIHLFPTDVVARVATIPTTVRRAMAGLPVNWRSLAILPPLMPRLFLPVQTLILDCISTQGWC